MSWLDYFVASNEPGAAPPPVRVRILNTTLAFLLIALVFCFSFQQVNYHWDWAAIWKYRSMFLEGWINTILISLAALVLSTCIGLFCALAQRSRLLPLRYLSKLYIEIVRGTPPPRADPDLLLCRGERIPRAESRQSGRGADPRGFQRRVHRGNHPRRYRKRRTLATGIGAGDRVDARAMLPLRGLPAGLAPDLAAARRAVRLAHQGSFSSLLCIISINEFTQNAREVNSYTFSTLESYIPLAVGYLLLTLPVSLWTRQLE